MTTTQEHLHRLHLLKIAREKQHIRPLATPEVMRTFVAESVDLALIERCDTAKGYLDQIQGFDISSTREAALARLESINVDTGCPIDTFLETVFLSVIDGTMRAFNKGTKQGLTATRIWHECKEFKYATAVNDAPMVDSYTEILNERQNIAEFGSQTSYDGKEMHRNGQDVEIRDRKKMKDTKEDHFNGRYRAKDEYDGDDIYLTKAYANSKKQKDRYAEVDHIVSCAEIFNNLKGNKALHLKDIQRIVNIDENYAVTSKQNNAGSNIGKFDRTRDELQQELDQGYVQFKNSIHYLTPEEMETRRTIIKKMDEAQKEINTLVNLTVVKNVFTDTDVQVTLGTDAAIGAAHLAIGDVVMFAIKPLYYELNDCIRHGIEDGVKVSSFAEALDTRLGRMKDHVWAQILPMLSDTTKNFMRNFLSMLLEGIINCFVGVFKHIARVVKEGVKLLINAFPILMDEKSTKAQKSEALLKLGVSTRARA